MIFTDVVMPDGKTAYFRIDEKAEAGEICREIVRLCDCRAYPAGPGLSGRDERERSTDGPGFVLKDAQTGRDLLNAQSLSAQGIVSGTRLIVTKK
ncbi:MAG: hypothetical protein IKS87_03860 [Lachnospiraceae bacterium]|nr:hypothetical protein [Lachnospiraceae bacterium]